MNMMKSVAETTTIQTLHERICLYFLIATDPALEATVGGFDTTTGMETVVGVNRAVFLQRFAEALYAFEQLNGGEEHPVADLIGSIAGYPGLHN
ncbi:hypothetical protein [Aliiroseovarius marinus]|uniref:hypothetical protein n=1 Tax=Aliiroseovarius marinus TaxID=2500159 RepID=UPI002493D4A4|nr:hypothetical protein [Aliiroseovarius marinus]